MNKKVVNGWCFCLFLQLLFLNVSHASNLFFTWQKDLFLEKEQKYYAKVLLDSVQKLLVLRWTLYKNNGLVIHLHYDGFNHQAILYKDYQRAGFSLTLGENLKPNPKLHIFFKNFDDKKAHLRLFLEEVGASIVEESPKDSEKGE
ncbi:MAG: hypothetical protein MSA68_04780 [Helicobacter sp.]|nr:hypothetical protein [Helicobacter sp.]